MSECERGHDEQKPSKGGSKINWGAIIAGAAVVAGVMLVAPTLIPNLITSISEGIQGAFSSISTAIAGIGTGAAVEEAAGAAPAAAGYATPAWAAATGQFIANHGGSAVANNVGWAVQGAGNGLGAAGGAINDASSVVLTSVAKKIAGVALVGGAAVYLLGDKKETPEVHYSHASHRDEGFRMKEDIRKMQALMKLRHDAIVGAAAGPSIG